jgi:hypothetical protein
VDLESALKITFRKLEVAKQLGGPTHKWDDNIKTKPTDTGCENMGWIHMIQIRVQWRNLVKTVLNFGVS